MSNPIEIFDKSILKAHYNRANLDDFLIHEAREMLEDKILDITKSFKDAYEITRQDEVLQEGENKYDIIKSCLQLHWINDLPGVLAQSFALLKPDGMFIANMFGGQTLKELREAFSYADPNSLSPRISPFIDVQDGGMLLQRAGFNLPVIDTEKISISYESAFHLMHHLRKIGETNALKKQRKNFTAKSFMMKVAEYYAEHFSNEEGRIEATFEIITLTGWKPHTSQQKPLARGSAKTSLTDALE